ncbi:hypothetical protein N7474_006062 [Penicillium riverlandense]|uniref:uncharacterized protein n=1 Tax=Penicillium riverlandense TaxID=1903569 RepID=UPI0025472254|nr:uncharacterized protein N7474_006062 [Penicillium riverlandense]KAJ5820471.1 hypothetical protein N7474_006062 [Penicillium riverlandense]
MHFQTSLLASTLFAALAVSQYFEVIAPDDYCYLQAGTSDPDDTVYGCHGTTGPIANNNGGDCSDLLTGDLGTNSYSLCGTLPNGDHAAQFNIWDTYVEFADNGFPAPMLECDMGTLASGANCIGQAENMTYRTK